MTEVIVHSSDEDGQDLVGSWPVKTRHAAVIEASMYAWAMSKLGILHTAVAWWEDKPQVQFEVVDVDSTVALTFTREAQAIAQEHLNMTFELDDEIASFVDGDA